MNFDGLECLIDYNYWARDKVLDAIEPITQEQFVRVVESSFKSIRDTVAHLCDAERIWIARLKGEELQGPLSPERIPNVHAARVEWTGLERKLREHLAGLYPENIDRSVVYSDLRGNKQSDLVHQILQHMVNHGSYHRGQVTTMLRQLDAMPPNSMDLISFYRERKRL